MIYLHSSITLSVPIVISARQHNYAERAICYRLSVRLSHGWISQKRSKLGSCKLHHATFTRE